MSKQQKHQDFSKIDEYIKARDESMLNSDKISEKTKQQIREKYDNNNLGYNRTGNVF